MSLILKLITVFFMVIASFPAIAQDATSPLPNLLRLTDSASTYDLGRHLYVTPDPTGRLLYSDLIEGHLGTHRGAISDRTLLSLGAQSTPHWIVFSVRNDTRAQERWVLSLGAHIDGTYGTFAKMFVFDHLTKKYLLYAMPDKSGNLPALKTLPLNGAGIPVQLAPGQQMLLAIYAVPEGGAPTTIAPRLMTEQAFWAAQNNIFGVQSAIVVTLIITGGFFLGMLAFRRRLIAIPVLLYIGAQLALYMLYNQTHLSDMRMASESSLLLFGVVIILGFMMSRFFLGITAENKTENTVLNGLITAFLMIGVMATLAIPENSVLRPALLTFAPVAGLLILFCLSMAQSLTGKPSAALFGSGWLILLIGAIVTVLAVNGTLPDNALLIRAYWFALILQMAVIVMSSVYQSWLGEQTRKKAAQNAEEDAESFSLVRQAKDSSENARLLRVIEHERQMLQDLRDRELQQNEEMRAAKETADMANRAKSAFLAVISHEIRTPMSGIMGMVRLLLDTQLTKDQKDYARTIQDSGDAMLALLNDILDFEKIETGKMDLEIVDFDLSRLVNDIMTLMSGHASQKKIMLRSDMNTDVPRFIRGDPVRLRQVLLNLTGNAIKFTSEGSVTLSVKIASNEGLQQPGWTRLYFGVRDSGIGISKEAQKNLFNPFSQADSSISRKYGGSGLGLAICQRLIEAMGGKISIDSTEGQGSTFYFSISMEEGQADRIEDNSQSTPARGLSQKPEYALNILCVDDNEVNQKLLREFVSRLGHTPVLAGSGEEALEILNQQDFDMVLMDIQLPGISGMGATRAIRALTNPAKAALPVIALTGNVRDEDIRNCYAANMNGHLAKPIEPEKLRAQIEKVMRGTLDNPVSLEDNPQETRSTTEVKINIDAIAATADDTFTLDDDTGIAQSDIAPIRAFALNAETLSDTDLNEDSFAGAIADDTATHPTDDDPTVFNHAMLDGLKSSMAPADMMDMIDSLLDKLDEIMIALDLAVENNDTDTIRMRAHELKGMGANFGLGEMAAIALALEKAASGDVTPDGLKDIIFDLPEANDRARAAIDRWITS